MTRDSRFGIRDQGLGISDSMFGPHRRFNPLRQEWVLVSPHRTERPWQGQVEAIHREQPPSYDPQCYLCPGNRRSGGHTNPRYESTFVFENDFAALVSSSPDGGHSVPGQSPLFMARAERGICRVVCFGPRHDLTLPRMEVEQLTAVVDRWIAEHVALASIPWISYVLIFENRGPMMGASNPHPHGQIWATESIPNEPAREQASLLGYRSTHGGCLLCDYLAAETAARERIICENDAFVAVVPFWAVWPFETMLIARRHFGAIDELIDAERRALADVLRRLTTRYDNLFETSFPYSMGFHQRPLIGDEAGLHLTAHETRGGDAGVWHFHAHVYPPLLRSASIRKFMVGFEMLGSPQRDVTPEAAAARLRDAGEIHYLSRIESDKPRT
jgi:UDPglucose--hexose-1-phosphate uridylyltransferase